ncbi:MAG: mechanosensitive ion channel family protein [Candidatus Hodarchaeales archaeon]|jgi:hypothetical protein
MIEFIQQIQIWLESAVPFILLIPLVLFIWLIGKILKFIIIRISFIPPDTKNIITFSISVLQILIITMGSFYILGASQEFILGFSALMVTVIGFASTSIASNVYGGLYLIITRPFKVGDLIRTQKAIGIVDEIGLNFTKIIQIDKTPVIIPNSNLLNVSLLNYSIKFPRDDIPHSGVLKTFEAIKLFSTEFYFDAEYIKYRAFIQIQLNVRSPPISIKELTNRLDKVCEEFKPVFGLKPEYYLGKYEFRQSVYFLITAPDGYTIFNSWSYFLESLVTGVFLELQTEEN